MKKMFYCVLSLLFFVSACSDNQQAKQPRSNSFFYENQEIAKQILDQCETDPSDVVQGECEAAKAAVKKYNFTHGPGITIR